MSMVLIFRESRADSSHPARMTMVHTLVNPSDLDVFQNMSIGRGRSGGARSGARCPGAHDRLTARLVAAARSTVVFCEFTPADSTAQNNGLRSLARCLLDL